MGTNSSVAAEDVDKTEGLDLNGLSLSEFGKQYEEFKEPSPGLLECIFCRGGMEEGGEDLIKLSCGHDTCNDCILQLFTVTMKDMAYFPPKCCSPIPLSTVADKLEPDKLIEFALRKIESQSSAPTYCAIPDCGHFIRPSSIKEKIGRCTNCGEGTCTICKKKTHAGICAEDPEIRGVISLAQQMHWRRCSSCETMIEHSHGCNEMACRCGHVFCFNCGAEWKTCDCPHFTDWRNHMAPPPGPPVQILPVRHPLVGPRMNIAHEAERVWRLFNDRHDPPGGCTHTHWRRVRGTHDCSFCEEVLTGFILECHDCGVQACARCKRDRPSAELQLRLGEHPNDGWAQRRIEAVRARRAVPRHARRQPRPLGLFPPLPPGFDRNEAAPTW